MTKVEVTQAQQELPELLSRVGESNERIIIEQQGKGKVAMISYEDFKRFQALEEEAQEIAEVERRIAADEETVSLEELIDGYNARHGTDFTLESIVNDD